MRNAWEAGMPYDSISDLPREQTDQYSRHQKHAFLKAFNSALDQYQDESRAFAVAWGAVKKNYHKNETTGKWEEGASS